MDLGATVPIYLSEPSGVLAANGRRLCKERWCGLDEDDEDDQSDLRPQIAFFIRLGSRFLSMPPHAINLLVQFYQSLHVYDVQSRKMLLPACVGELPSLNRD